MKFTYDLCKMRRPRGSLFGQCVSAFIYSAYRPLVAAAKLANLNKLWLFKLASAKATATEQTRWAELR